MVGIAATHWLAARGYRLMQETEEGEGREGGGEARQKDKLRASECESKSKRSQHNMQLR